MNEANLTFTLDEFDDAVVKECAKITAKYDDKPTSATMFILAGMSFSAGVKNRLINSKKEKMEE